MSVPSCPRMPKQAIVIVHGMGEQRPLDTLRSFVETVWGGDHDLTRADRTDPKWPPTPKGQKHDDNPFWIKPDSRAGSYELRRFTTPEFTTEQYPQGIRTDFFECYWADIMEGSELRHLLSWLRNMLFRRWKNVPKHVLPLWCLLWAMFIAFLVSGVAILWHFSPFPPIAIPAISPEKTVTESGQHSVTLWPFVIRSILAIAVMFGGVYLVLRSVKVTLTIVLVMLAAAILLFLQNSETDRAAILNPWGWASAAWLLIIYGLYSAVLPYFGDVARYTQSTPVNVQKRQDIRSRGVQLLKALHEGDEYQRVVLVGHSLGSVIAYDLLTQFWADHGPSSRNPPDEEALAALKEVDRLSALRKGELPQLEKFQDAQRKVSRALADQKARRQKALGATKDDQGGVNWLITDFVTLGAALTHSEFLVARTPSEFRNLMGERMVSTCPPAVERNLRNDPTQPLSMLYETKTRAGPIMLPHHAAVFSAVRWTNIYDKRKFIVFGDFVSGPLHRLFGWGVHDVPVEIMRPGWGPLGRFFTHTLYWTSLSKIGTDKHIGRLRAAINLKDA